MYVCIYIYICVYIHIHTYIHTHAHTYARYSSVVAGYARHSQLDEASRWLDRMAAAEAQGGPLV